jgi:hypothetical protein
MEFDRSAIRHSLRVVPWEPGQFDVARELTERTVHLDVVALPGG